MVETIFIGDKPIGDAHGGKVAGVNAEGSSRNFAVATAAQAKTGVGSEIMTVTRTKEQIDALVADVDVLAVSTFTPTVDHNGKLRVLSHNSELPVILGNNLPRGFSISIVQGGAGQIAFSAASGSTIHQADGMTKSRKQWSPVTAVVISNVGGASAVWLLIGELVA